MYNWTYISCHQIAQRYYPQGILYIRLTTKKSDQLRAFNQFTIACEPGLLNCNVCGEYCIYHVEFKVCCSFQAPSFKVWKKIIIKHLLNSVFATWCHAEPHPIIAFLNHTVHFSPWVSKNNSWIILELRHYSMQMLD